MMGHQVDSTGTHRQRTWQHLCLASKKTRYFASYIQLDHGQGHYHVVKVVGSANLLKHCQSLGWELIKGEFSIQGFVFVVWWCRWIHDGDKGTWEQGGEVLCNQLENFLGRYTFAIPEVIPQVETAIFQALVECLHNLAITNNYTKHIKFMLNV